MPSTTSAAIDQQYSDGKHNHEEYDVGWIELHVFFPELAVIRASKLDSNYEISSQSSTLDRLSDSY
jgi:hypothetical protein